MDVLDWRQELISKARNAVEHAFRARSEGRDEAARCWVNLRSMILFTIRKFDSYIDSLYMDPTRQLLELGEIEGSAILLRRETAAVNEIEALIGHCLIRELFICQPVQERLQGRTITGWAEDYSQLLIETATEWYSAGLGNRVGNHEKVKKHVTEAEKHEGDAEWFEDRFSDFGYVAPVVEPPEPPEDRPSPDFPPIPPDHA